MKAKFRLGALIAVLAGAVAAVYLPALHYGYLNFDDNDNVFANPDIYPVRAESYLRFWSRPYVKLYIPVTASVWAATAWLARWVEGAEPLTCPGAEYFHALNIALHIANAILVLLLLRLILSVPVRPRKNGGGPGRRDAAAALGALLFALHPVQVETVVWITALKDLLSAFFSLLALWQYASYRRNPGRGRRRLAAAAAAFILALLSQPSAVALPLIAAALDRGVFHRPWRDIFRRLGWCLAVVLPVVVLTKFLQPDRIIRDVPPFLARFPVAADALIFYLGKILLPVRLAIDYGRTPHFVIGRSVAILPVMALAVPVLLCWRRKIRGVGAAAVGIGLIGFLPVSGLIPFAFQSISTVKDRYLYLVLLGPALGLAWMIFRSRRRAFPVAALTALLLFGAGSVAQRDRWRNVLELYGWVVQVNPRSALGHYSLANYLARRGIIPDLGIPYRRNWETDPDAAFILSPRERGERAIGHYRRVMELDPADTDAYNNCGYVLAELGRPAEAVVLYEEALRIDPGFARAHLNLANTLSVIGRPAAALRHYREALRFDPGYAKAYYNLALFHHRRGESREALIHYTAALREDPDFPEAEHNRRLLLDSLASPLSAPPPAAERSDGE